jgi:hypothetical protein
MAAAGCVPFLTVFFESMTFNVGESPTRDAPQGAVDSATDYTRHFGCDEFDFRFSPPPLPIGVCVFVVQFYSPCAVGIAPSIESAEFSGSVTVGLNKD